jgi:hypothetical protein
MIPAGGSYAALGTCMVERKESDTIALECEFYTAVTLCKLYFAASLVYYPSRHQESANGTNAHIGLESALITNQTDVAPRRDATSNSAWRALVFPILFYREFGNNVLLAVHDESSLSSKQ